MMTSPLLITCILMAANAYQVPAAVMAGIMAVEGGHVGQAAGPNLNGTYDLGPMQVNSSWMPQLAQIWHVNKDTAYTWVRDNACENVYVAAWILKQNTVKSGTLFGGLARYNSTMPYTGYRYATRVVAVMEHEGLIQHNETKTAQNKPEQIATTLGSP